jgi:hypothetical protein
MAGWEIAISFFPYWEIDDPKGVGTEIRHSKKHSAWLEKKHIMWDWVKTCNATCLGMNIPLFTYYFVVHQGFHVF